MLHALTPILSLGLALWTSLINASPSDFEQETPLFDPDDYSRACPDYAKYVQFKHEPLSTGPMKLPFQRPSQICRTFSSPLVEKVIQEVTEAMVDKDLARVFENAFPNTLDTTIRWHIDGPTVDVKSKETALGKAKWTGAQSFVVTGDINAEWLRDSTNQLLQYQPLAKKDLGIFNLILGAINTQTEYVIESPYCNAFQPPPASHLAASANGQKDQVHPNYEPSFVFECKYELDSLAHFLSLANSFHNNTGSLEFLTPRWLKALGTVMTVIDQQSQSTFNSETGKFEKNVYTFSRQTDQGTETLPLNGVGNPLNYGTGLIRSAFRPSDDATILGFLIPANAQMAVELKRTAKILMAAKYTELAHNLEKRAQTMMDGIWEHGVFNHKKYGQVFAYEVDGYGSQILMDDANVPSLLSLPLLGFVDASNPIYQNTRKMLLEKSGNPYYLEGSEFHGIGGPHVGLNHAWPMSLLIQAMTTDNDEEIKGCLKTVLSSCHLGLVHEGINVDSDRIFSRSWFAWANSVFSQTILEIARKKPYLLFGEGAKPYIIDST